MQKTILAGLLSIGLLSSAHVSAASNWSVHFNAGLVEYDADNIEFDDDSDSTFSVGLAYALSNTVSIEAAYNDFGSAVVNGIDLDFSSVSFALVGGLPLSNNLTLTGKLGVERLEGEAAFTINNAFLNTSFNIDEEDTEAFAGIGLDYAFNPTMSLRTNLDFHDSGDINVLTAGLKYNF